MFQAEKFGDSFVFENLLSEAVKSEIDQAVSDRTGPVSVWHPFTCEME